MDNYSSSARSLVKKGAGATSPPHSNNSTRSAISTVGGFYVSVMETAKSATSSSSTRPKQLQDRTKASSIGPCPSKDGMINLDAMGLVMHSAQVLASFGVERGDIDGIVAMMRSKPQDDHVQVVCVHELLYVLRHDPSDYTLQTLFADNIVPFLLKLVREFRFHVVLQTDIMHVMLLFAKLAAEQAQVLVREAAGALIAKTMALHPTEDRLQQYATSLLQTLRTTAASTGPMPGKAPVFDIAYFNSDSPSSTTRQPATLWAPTTGESSCHKHHASPLEPFQLVSAKSQALAERSRTPELSQSKLRRVLSSPKVPTLTANGTTLHFTPGARPPTLDKEEVAPTPLLRPDSCPAFDQLTIDVASAELPAKPMSSQSTLRRKNLSSVARLTPMMLASPTLGAYRSSPLFVEPVATAERVEATHGKLPSKQHSKRTTTTRPPRTVETPVRASLPPCEERQSGVNNEPSTHAKPKSPHKNKFPPDTLSDHRAAKCLQRYFRRILKASTSRGPRDVGDANASTKMPGSSAPQHPHEGDKDSLDDKLIQRDEDELLLRSIQASFCRGLHLHARHKYDAAREAYEGALEVQASVSFASVVVNVGATYLSQGEYAKALEAFETAEQMHPHHPKAMYNAGLAQWHLGNPAIAASKFTSVLAADPSHAKAIHALHLLRTHFDVRAS